MEGMEVVRGWWRGVLVVEGIEGVKLVEGVVVVEGLEGVKVEVEVW